MNKLRVAVLLVALVALVGTATALRTINMDPALRNHPTETHHSLHAPLDKSQVYWNFGGSTVMTKNFIRLTPSTQDRKGWLWNEYPLESENWEVEFKLKIFSKPHFGGDGFAFWVLAGDQDPAFSREPDFLNGPVFGMKSDFQGFGVCFDVYDNDNRRNNPSVFVLDNPEGKITNYNHDIDYEDDMVKAVPAVVPGHTESSSRKPYKAHKCVADLRNLGDKDARVLVKYLHKVLHVYIDTSGTPTETKYKFCFAVELGRSFVDHHIAFSAATGQVADNHDVVEITTRYLSEKDKDFDDSQLSHFEADGEDSEVAGFVSFVVFILGGALLVFAGFQFQTYRTLTGQHIDESQICRQLNENVLRHWGAHAGLTLLLLVNAEYTMLLFNLPLAALRGYLYQSNNYRFAGAIASQGLKGHSGSSLVSKLSINTRIYMNLVVYALCELYYCYAFLF